ncbi:MAG: 1-acyl-sn-glycerol-3-phosphate acyltransferase [Flavobacteriales bacterium]|nr:1-acyl-sn-glycerol-3-phosphate acyltransferase [Flavobacteriales bacterium]
MKPFYLFLKISVYSLSRIFFKKHKLINPPKKVNQPIILVSNHPSSFMDPILIGSEQNLSIHFMVRGDVFNKWLMPVFSGAQMLPIFRTREDGKDAAERNEATFKKVRKLLQRGKAILFFAEGYTDDVFIRSLKPVKKGPIRLAFETMDECGWSEKLYFQALGLNYSHPKYMRTDILWCYSDLIDVHDYRQLYIEKPKVAITKLTRDIQEKMQQQISYAKNQEVADLLEDIISLTAKGMNHENHLNSIPLEDRFNYTRSLASTLNDQYDDEKKSFPAQLATLKDKAATYFKDLADAGVKEKWVRKFANKTNNGFLDILYFIIFFPFFVLGLVHHAIPYIFVKWYVEKNFKRSVFWSSTKLVMGYPVFGIFNIPAIFLFMQFVYPSFWLGLAYYFLVIPPAFLIAYVYRKRWLDFVGRSKVKASTLTNFSKRRAELLNEIEQQQF